jgi:hypothetical protein
MRSRPLFFFPLLWRRRLGWQQRTVTVTVTAGGLLLSSFRLLVRAKISFALRIPPYLRHLPGAWLGLPQALSCSYLFLGHLGHVDILAS